MIQAFNFEDGGRTYTCTLEERRGAVTEAWWWFGVSGDQHRYAPFQAAPGDTPDSVRSRIVAYYSDLLVRRSQPPAPRQHWSHRGKPAASPAAPSGPSEVAPA